MEDDDSDLTFTRLNILAWRVVPVSAAKRPGRRKAATKSAVNLHPDHPPSRQQDQAREDSVVRNPVQSSHGSPQTIEVVFDVRRGLENAQNNTDNSEGREDHTDAAKSS